MICEILNDTYLFPECYDKKDFSKVEKLAGSGAVILNELSLLTRNGKSVSVNDFCNRICGLYEADETEKNDIVESVLEFLSASVKKGYVLYM